MTLIIESYFKEYKTIFDEKFLIVLESFNMEAIHKMRTSTKRLRALFILIETLSDEKFRAKKQLRKIRSLFKFAGKIREIQIEKYLVISYQSLLDANYTEYLEYLKQREHREISRFLKHLPSLDERNSIIDESAIISIIKKIPKDKTKNRTDKFIGKKQKRIALLMAKPDSNERIHETRTHLKQVNYLNDILTNLSNKNMLLGLDALRLREIEQYFGNWHDLVNSPVYMNSFFKTKKFTGDPKYKLLKKRIADDRKQMRKEITRNLYKELKVQSFDDIKTTSVAGRSSGKN